MKKMNFDIAVIGGGPAGLAAALSARENGIEKVLILERDKELGGILNQCIHNGFGLHYFKEEFTGPGYADKFIKLVEKQKNLKVMLNTFVTKIDGKNIEVTRLAYGLPVGASLDYADEFTLIKAMQGRRKL